jgi:holo-[acyl-carrier protein] synthase
MSDGVAAPGAVLGVGTDLVEVDRLRTALDRTPGLADRLFTAAERNATDRHRDPLPHLAARFAAKESVMKALGRGIGAMSFTDIEVVSEASGAPSAVLSGRARTRADELGVGDWHLSLSHTATLAQAVAVASR